GYSTLESQEPRLPLSTSRPLNHQCPTPNPASRPTPSMRSPLCRVVPWPSQKFGVPSGLPILFGESSLGELPPGLSAADLGIRFRRAPPVEDEKYTVPRSPICQVC